MPLANLNFSNINFAIEDLVAAANSTINEVNLLNSTTIPAISANVTSLNTTKAANSYVNSSLSTLETTLRTDLGVDLTAGLALKLDIASYTASDILAKLLTVDGTGSGIDADLFDGLNSSYFLNATNITSGTLPNGRLSGSYTNIVGINASGNVTALNLAVTDAVSSNTLTANSANVSGAITGSSLVVSGNTSANNLTVTRNITANTLAVTFSVAANTLSGNGSAITSVNAISFNAQSDTAFARFAVNGTFSKAQRVSFTTLTDAANVAINLNDNNLFKLTLGANRTIDNPSNMASSVGQEVALFIAQDGTGSRTASFQSFWKFPGGIAPTLTSTASAVDCIVGVVYSTTQIMCAGVIRDLK